MIVRFVRWLWRHMSRTAYVRTASNMVEERTVEFCSSPSCTCGREKRVAPPPAIVVERPR